MAPSSAPLRVSSPSFPQYRARTDRRFGKQIILDARSPFKAPWEMDDYALVEARLNVRSAK